MASGALLLGSYENFPEQTVSVTQTSPENCTVSAGNYYLDDPTNSVSVCAQLAAALTGHSEITVATCWIGEDRLVHLAATQSFTLSWGSATILRDMLGFTGNLSPAATQFDADVISDYLWHPNKPEAPDSLLATHGNTIWDTRFGMAGGGRIVTTTNVSRTENKFGWRFVTDDRFRTTDELGGEYHTFWNTVLSQGLRFTLYRNRTSDDTSDTDIALSSLNRFGPYKLKGPSSGSVGFQHRRAERWIDATYHVDIPVMQVDEYS